MFPYRQTDVRLKMEPRVDLSYYRGSDLYSDGDVEDEILEIFKTQKDVTRVLKNDNRWPVLYHLSPERNNLLEWYPFDKTASLLEIGAGCGALTGLFCEKTGKVLAVELSKRRAEIISHRCRRFGNLEIIAGNLKDIKFKKKFHYVTLIGVLEYADSFIEEKEPHATLLKIVCGMLRKEGKLLLAIENKFGLKYFAGAKEDHTGQLYSGIEGYIANENVKTFGKEELKELLAATGFTESKFYYPYPDYKFPTEIFSEDYLPEINHNLFNSPNYDIDRLNLFNERLALLNIIKNKHFDFFSNSFLVIASKGN